MAKFDHLEMDLATIVEAVSSEVQSRGLTLSGVARDSGVDRNALGSYLAGTKKDAPLSVRAKLARWLNESGAPVPRKANRTESVDRTEEDLLVRSISEILQRILAEEHPDRERMAATLGVGLTTISQLLQPNRNFQLRTLSRLLSAMGWRVVALPVRIGEDDEVARDRANAGAGRPWTEGSSTR